MRSDTSSAEEEDSDSDNSLREEVIEDDGVLEMILFPQKKVHLGSLAS